MKRLSDLGFKETYEGVLEWAQFALLAWACLSIWALYANSPDQFARAGTIGVLAILGIITFGRFQNEIDERERQRNLENAKYALEMDIKRGGKMTSFFDSKIHEHERKEVDTLRKSRFWARLEFVLLAGASVQSGYGDIIVDYVR